MSGTCVERTQPGPRLDRGALGMLGRFLGSARFPLTALALIAAFEAWLALMLLIPVADSGLGAFADEFRIWCFGYDPATGKLDWAYTVMLFADPLALAAVIGVIWREPLRAGIRHSRRSMALLFAAAFAAVVALSVGLLWKTPERNAGELPFPAETIRTAIAPPPIALMNQEGREVRLESLRGKVVVVTGIYASCGHTCPLLMAQAKRALAALPVEEREEVRVLAITLDPAFDTREVLSAAAVRYLVGSPEFQFLTGEPERVNQVLDALQIARKKNPHSGVIDHSNLFVVIDKQGKVAYRLTIGDRQERWLISALRLLSRERPDTGA